MKKAIKEINRKIANLHSEITIALLDKDFESCRTLRATIHGLEIALKIMKGETI